MVLNNVIRTFICADAGWIDVMIPVAAPDVGSAVPLIEGMDSDGGWLTVLFSGVRRTSKPTMIPIEVNGTPWRGSANAFVSHGVDYVGSFSGLYSGRDYGLPGDVLDAVEAKYEYWRRECYFAALLAVGIQAPGRESSESIGVLNVNFVRENRSE